MNDYGANFIYESPDNGKTVFRRVFGADHSELVCRQCKVGTFLDIVEGTHTCTTCGYEIDSIEYSLAMGYR